jgi:hypothetical protein
MYELVTIKNTQVPIFIFNLFLGLHFYLEWADFVSFVFIVENVKGYLRNKSWKPECVGSFTMDWRILVFYPEPEARVKIS